MNAEELKRVVDETIGMVGKLTVHGKSGEIHYFTSTGLDVLQVVVHESGDGGWHFDGGGHTTELFYTIRQAVERETE